MEDNVDFNMTAMPGYTYFNREKKVVVDMVIVSGDTTKTTETKHSDAHMKGN